MTWLKQNSGFSGIGASLQDVSFTDANHGTVVGASGILLHTTNGGATWVRQSSGTNNFLNSVIFTDANIGTVVGEYGTILRTTTGGVVSVRNNTSPQTKLFPRLFILEQNYPNPFNPTTTIEFSLLRPGYVTLKIFSLLGQEVATLAMEELPTGQYTKQWNADVKTLANGVYFYKLSVRPLGQTREWSETKKLLLLK
jgi:hypothetical protein